MAPDRPSHLAVQPAELVANDVADLGVGRGRVCVQLDQEQVAVREQVAVAGAHHLEDRARIALERAARPAGRLELQPSSARSTGERRR